MTDTAGPDDRSDGGRPSIPPPRPGLRRLPVAARVSLPVLATALGALVVVAFVWIEGGELRSAWRDMRAVRARHDQITAVERATVRLNREVKGFLDTPDESARADVERMKSEFTGELWRLRDGARPEESEDVETFTDTARRYLVGFDDLRGLEIDVTLLYEGEFEELAVAIRERLDALDLAIRPGDLALRPKVALAYDRFATFRLHLVAYRRDRDLAQIDAARRARDEFEAAIAAVGENPGPDSRTYAIERFGPLLERLDAMFTRLVAISWRKSLWLGGYVDGNRDAMNDAIDRLVVAQQAREGVAFDRFETLLGRLLQRILVAATLALAAGIAGARLVARSITEPLAEQRRALEAMALGDHERPCTGLDAADEIGDVTRALEVLRRDLAERARLAEDDDRRERRWLSVLETSPIAIAVLSAVTGRIEFTNRRWRELFAADAGGAAPETGNDLARRFVDPAIAARLADRVADRGGVSAWQAEMRGVADATWWALMEVRPIEFAGRPAHILWVYDDSEGRRAEEEVRRARDHAEAALARLARARDDLVEAAELAAVGALVAGVAHEVNNPVGIGLTVATTLVDRADAFAAEVAAGTLRRSRLDDFVAAVRDASTQLVANLTRAADLVLAFKQVAVDRTHPDRRAFDLAEATEQIAASLKPGLRATPHRLEVEVPAGLAMDGYPGALGQILTNLFMNAMSHAFTDGRSGVMKITARSMGEDRVAIVFSDDGVGMDADTARRAFEPFFTTRRGRGGSGLGLHIVRTLVVNRMGGRIRIDTAPRAGCRFEITVPRVAPDGTVASRDREEGNDAPWSTTS
jgi:signal transduction histidine kinase